MLKTTLLISTLLTVSLTVLSQDLKIKCGDQEIDCQNGNKEHFRMIVYCPYAENDSTKIPKTILDTAKKYLTNRIGETFYEKLNYYGCQIIDTKIKQKRDWKKLCDKRVKYGIQYYFVVQDSMKYYLSIVFDKSGNIISKDQLPNFKSNDQFDKIISVCDTKLIAEQDTVFPGRLLGISLEYSASANTFVWRVEKPSVLGAKPRENIHRFILINAVNGQIVKRETESWTSVCQGNSF